MLQFVLYRTSCIACVLTQQFRIDLPLAMVVRVLFRGGGGALGSYPPSSPALLAPVLAGQHIRIVSADSAGSHCELTRYGMSEERVRPVKRHIIEAWDSLVMDDEIGPKGNVTRDEALLVMHFLQHAHNAHSYPPQVSGNRHHTLRTDAMVAALCVVCGNRGHNFHGKPPNPPLKKCKLEINVLIFWPDINYIGFNLGH